MRLLSLRLRLSVRTLVRYNLDLYVTWKQKKIDKSAFPAKYSQIKVSLFFDVEFTV